MSDFHDALRRAAQRHGEQVAPGLSADAVVASSVHGISRGRRRRTAAQAGLGALGVAVLGVGGWLVLPLAGPGESEPAGPDDEVHAGPYRYSVESDKDVREGDPELLLRGDDRVMCGDELDLTPGVTVHEPGAFDRGLYQEAELTTLGATVGTPTAEPQPLNPDDPDGLMTGWDPSQPTWDGIVGGQLVATESVSLLMDGDVVVGQVAGSSGGGSMDSLRHGSGGAPIPREGECENSDLPFKELLDLEHGDPMDTLLVTQYWGGAEPGKRVALGERVLLATIVVDPNEPANTSESPSLDDLPAPEPTSSASVDPQPTSGPVDSAALRAPEGDDYQAFVVERPQPGCAPLADLLAAGHPTTENADYTVEIPGVTDNLTGQLWGAEPVVIDDGAVGRWYVGRDAWMVADGVSAGIADPHVGWTSLSSGGWALSSGGDDPLRGGDCGYDAPIPEIDGAVFLVIDGADWGSPSLSSLLQTGFTLDDYQTWVYLGEAE